MRGKFITGPVAVLVLLFFFLPWVTVSCSGQPLGQFSGYELARGITTGVAALPGDTALFSVPLVALIALLGTGLAFIKRDWERPSGFVTAAAAALGLLVLLWRWFNYQSEADPLVTVSYEPGLWLTLLGLLLILGGGVLSIVWPRRTVVTASPAAAGPPPFAPQTFQAFEEPPRPALATILDEAEPTPVSARPRPTADSLAQTPIDWNLTDARSKAPAGETAVPPTEMQLPDTAVDLPIEKTEILADQPTILAWLIIRDGELAGSQYRLFNRTNIGRHPTNDIVLEDSAVSAVHATVVWDDGQFMLHDLQSTNGVYLKEAVGYSWQRVETAVLQDTMQIKLGRTVFHMMIVAPEQ
ncbi:MAG: FHA domain-containing protein [Ardenticatenaceae bacterium]|nr:FHA domain-containing protein [Ardenticatenaceae bacterium]MCB8986180.1 FHA domain-containing protein [Ardenticatenaceae bacterium]